MRQLGIRSEYPEFPAADPEHHNQPPVSRRDFLRTSIVTALAACLGTPSATDAAPMPGHIRPAETLPDGIVAWKQRMKPLITALVQQLNADSFEARERAQQELLVWMNVCNPLPLPWESTEWETARRLKDIHVAAAEKASAIPPGRYNAGMLLLWIEAHTGYRIATTFSAATRQRLRARSFEIHERDCHLFRVLQTLCESNALYWNSANGIITIRDRQPGERLPVLLGTASEHRFALRGEEDRLLLIAEPSTVPLAIGQVSDTEPQWKLTKKSATITGWQAAPYDIHLPPVPDFTNAYAPSVPKGQDRTILEDRAGPKRMQDAIITLPVIAAEHPLTTSIRLQPGQTETINWGFQKVTLTIADGELVATQQLSPGWPWPSTAFSADAINWNAAALLHADVQTEHGWLPLSARCRGVQQERTLQTRLALPAREAPVTVRISNLYGCFRNVHQTLCVCPAVLERSVKPRPMPPIAPPAPAPVMPRIPIPKTM